MLSYKFCFTCRLLVVGTKIKFQLHYVMCEIIPSMSVDIPTCFEMYTRQSRLECIPFSFHPGWDMVPKGHSTVVFSGEKAILRTAGHSFLHPCNKLLFSLLCQMLENSAVNQISEIIQLKIKINMEFSSAHIGVK